MSKELLAELRWKGKVHGTWKEGQATWEEYRNDVTACSDVTRNAKVHLELKVARDVKDNKKGFCKYITNKRKTRENVGLLLNWCPGDRGCREGRATECLLCFSV